MSIVIGIITFVVFYADMIWMNCIYPEMYKGKKESEEIEAKSKLSSLICIIVLAIVVAITYFATLSKIVLFASAASLFMCILIYLSFTKFIKKIKAEDDDYIYDNDYEESWFGEDYDEDKVPGNIFQEYDDGYEDDEYGEDEISTFEQYNGKDAEESVEIFEEDVDEDIVDIIDGKIYK